MRMPALGLHLIKIVHSIIIAGRKLEIMSNATINLELGPSIQKAVSYYWKTRAAQKRRQKSDGKTDQGSRSAVTGGAQMDGFIN